MIAAGAALVLLVAMVLDTKIVKIGSAADVPSNVFSPANYGKSEFPKVQAGVQGRATDAAILAAAVIKDPDAAGKQYGIPADAGPELSVTFTGTAGKQDSGVYDVSVKGVPDSIHLSVQTGPAITGTDLRDATGTISVRAVQQPDRLPERRLGSQQGDEAPSSFEDRHVRPLPVRPSRWWACSN